MFGRLLLLFILVPVAELALFIKLGSKIGLGATLAIIVLTAILGAALTRSQGMQTLAKFQRATGEGRLPHAEVLDGIMILIAGAVLLTPGFLTDAIGFLLLVPPVRTQLRSRLGRALKGRVHVMGMPGQEAPPSRRPSNPNERVIEAKVIDVDES